ncbi:PucR family transcriptional regulator, partial [Streptomyces cinnamoneus]
MSSTASRVSRETSRCALPWYRAMPPENRSWIGLVAQAGIAA